MDCTSWKLVYRNWVDDGGIYYLLFRTICLIFSTTWFVPDETFQSVEVAYRMVYGRGEVPWEWQPKNALRSTLHPLLYAIPFHGLKIFGLDSNFLIRWTPNAIHALLFALADVSYKRWCRRLLSNQTNLVGTAMMLYLSNWFLLYSSTRTLSNTLETVLLIYALNWYDVVEPRNSDKREAYRWFIFFAATAILVRPTSICIMSLLYFYRFFINLVVVIRDHPTAVKMYLKRNMITVLPYASVPFFVAFTLDFWYYSNPNIVSWNFVSFNFLRGGSAYFGEHPFLWYFFNALPSLLTVCLLVFLYGCCSILRTLFYAHQNDRNKMKLLLMNFFALYPDAIFYAAVALIYIILHSFIAHKEIRFLMPVLPLIFPFFAHVIESGMSEFLRRWTKLAVLHVNIVLAIYIGLIHQRGPSAATSLILQEFSSQKALVQPCHIFQMMPCYSMPQYAALHPYAYNVEIRMLECTGHLKESQNDINGSSTRENEESWRFHDDPAKWLSDNWDKNSALAKTDMIVAFERTYEKVEPFFRDRGFEIRHRVFHTHIPISSRQSSHILISILKKP